MLTAAEVASLLGLKPREVLALAKDRQITCYRFSSRLIRFDKKDVEEYRRAQQPAAPPQLSAKVLRQYLRGYRKLQALGEADHLVAPTQEQIAIADSRHRNMRMPPWANGAAIRAIYAEARRLTKETGIPHHVDHDIPLQGEFVTGLHVETNLRVMVGVDNIRKRNRFEP